MIDPDHPATQAQIAAAMPYNSSWVSANAGSGKTRVLTDRVARLLLRGTQPSHILCLTYTKAAAAEMQNRLFARLGEWAMMEDAKLRDALRELGEDAQGIEADQLSNARTLFARALETPGGLKIQTIHSFCELLLRRFPLESGVSPQFEVMEDRQAALLRREVLEEIADAGALAKIARYLPSFDPEPVLRDILKHRTHFNAPPDESVLRRVLGVTETATTSDLVSDVLHALPADTMSALTGTLATHGGKNEKQALSALTQAREANGPSGPKLEALAKALLTAKHEIKVQALPTKAVAAAFPAAEDCFRTLSNAVLKAVERLKAQDAFARSQALYSFASDFLSRYEAHKAVLGKLDFDDLIDKARALLRDGEAAAWVQYRLDGGIDHVLVDEAQDTSLVQWDVIDALAADFFSGDGARSVARTIFVVGDEKQSIYSFQGADPAAFDAKKTHYSQTLDAAMQGLEQCELNYSFRSSGAVLSVVDEVFRRNQVHGLGDAINHAAFHSDMPGRVDLWPFTEKPETTEDEPWHLPVDHPPAGDPALILAEKVAGFIHDTLASGMALPGGGGRSITAGDFLILVRSRGKIFNALIRELKTHRVPVAGSDRLKVGGELAVRDLLAVLRFLLTEADDLSLAAALRSPIFGISEAELFALSHGRDGTLWQRLRHDPAHQQTTDILRKLRNQADFLRPFEILEMLLTTFGHRQTILARLGDEAEDGIDALLDLALKYEQVEAPTLTGFLEWMDSDDVEIKRQFDGGLNQVRVMTVHGAKGLEAPIVILPDTHKPGGSPNVPPVLMADGAALLRVPADKMPAPMRNAEDTRKQLDQQERWRLLYVAMTRAESWLIVCGGGDKGDAETAWYPAVEDAMAALTTALPDGGYTLAKDWIETPGDLPPVVPAASDIPNWTQLGAPPVAAKINLIAPSRDGGTAHALPGEGDETEVAMMRGSHLHLLLENFAALPVADWDTFAKTAFSDMPSNEVAALVAEARAVINAPHLRWIFDNDGMNEVAIAGVVPALGPRSLRGKIDRLIVADVVWALDFKSNRVVPKTENEVPDALIGQMALYHTALAAIWPDRVIRTGLVWTADATLIEVSQETVKNWLQSKWSG